MKHDVAHGLEPEKAKEVTEKALNAYKARFAEYNPVVTWDDAHRARIAFNVKGIELRGSVDVDARNISMDLEVPLLLRPFRGKAMAVIEAEIKKWIQKAKDGKI
jgi:hypothetical protein